VPVLVPREGFRGREARGVSARDAPRERMQAIWRLEPVRTAERPGGEVGALLIHGSWHSPGSDFRWKAKNCELA
jgi:hypothetical protein